MTRAEIEGKLVGILRGKLLADSRRPINPDAPLGELDIDSLALLEFMTSVETEFGVEIPETYWMQPQWKLSELSLWIEGKSSEPEADL